MVRTLPHTHDVARSFLRIGVPRILEGTLPAHLDDNVEHGEDWAPYAKYMRTTRINVNVRQVFPKGFEPPVP